MADRDGATEQPPELALALRDFYLKSQQAMDRLMRAHGASVARTRLLGFIARTSAVRSVDILEAFSLAPRTVTEALDGLERDGLVRREASTEDRRVKMILITPAGRDVLAIVEPVGRQFVELVFVALDEGERKTLAELTGKLNDRLDVLALASGTDRSQAGIPERKPEG